ncbi:hypothetical protein ABEW60_14835 [Paenibacillus jamilae]|uniref:hypothetical protein n=1 Tax=Paenibacillus jamilae TaxID=114136 RepID=UPI003D27AF0D
MGIAKELFNDIQDVSVALEIATYLEPLHHGMNRLNVGKMDLTGPLKELDV